MNPKATPFMGMAAAGSTKSTKGKPQVVKGGKATVKKAKKESTGAVKLGTTKHAPGEGHSVSHPIC